MIVSIGSPTDYSQAHPDRRARLITLHTNCALVQLKPRLKIAQTEGMPQLDRAETYFEYGLSLGLISPSPPHDQDTRGCHPAHAYEKGLTRRRSDGHAPLSPELRHCTAYPIIDPEATWAQPLGRGELS
jgi:hypothetical protein